MRPTCLLPVPIVGAHLSCIRDPSRWAGGSMDLSHFCGLVGGGRVSLLVSIIKDTVPPHRPTSPAPRRKSAPVASQPCSQGGPVTSGPS